MVRVTMKPVDILSMEGSVPTDATVQGGDRGTSRSPNTSGWTLGRKVEYMMSQKAEEAYDLETDALVDQLREDLPRFRRAEETRMLPGRKLPAGGVRWVSPARACV